MRKLYLKKAKEIFCQEDNRTYILKETNCKRFFLWIPKYAKGDEEIDPYNIKRNDYDSVEEYHAAWDVLKEHVEANKLLGHCIELGKTAYDFFLEQEKDTQKTLEPNKQHLASDGSNPHRVQIYERTPQENAKIRYEHKNNDIPLYWGALMGKWSRTYTKDVPKMMLLSDRFYENGEEITYDRDFFDSIDFNLSAAKKAYKELETFFKENKLNPNSCKRYKGCEDPKVIRAFLTQLRLEIYFENKAKEMQNDIKKIVGRNRSLLDSEVNYSLKYDSGSNKVRTSVYSHLH